MRDDDQHRADVPVSNDSPTRPRYVAGRMILPGETRLIPYHECPPHLRPSPIAAVPAAPATDPVLALLDGTIPTIAAALPGLEAAALDRLAAAEHDGKTRKGLLEAIAGERLRRAAVAEEGGDDDPAAPAGAPGSEPSTDAVTPDD